MVSEPTTQYLNNALFIDDSLMDHLIMKKMLKEFDVNLECVESGYEALEKLEHTSYKFIICDINLPGMDGFDIVSEIKDISRAEHTPFLFYTSTDIEDRLLSRAFKQGAFDVLSKKNSIISIKSKLRSIIELSDYKSLNINLVEKNEPVKKGRIIELFTGEPVKKENSKIEKRIFPNATVMFADFVDFTNISRELNLDQLIEKLHWFYEKFDEVMDEFGIHKIKTIGDSYMCASGVPIRNNQHTIMMILASLAIKRIVVERMAMDKSAGAIPWDIKFGIADGEVIAGFVNKDIKTLDIWGDTVNLASRFEGVAEPGNIVISNDIKSIIAPFFSVDTLGEVELKSVGRKELYSVLGLKEKFQDGDKFTANSRFYSELYLMDPYSLNEC